MKKLVFTFFVSFNFSYGAVYLRSLQDASTTKLSSFNNKHTLVTLFRANCSACRKQVQDLSCLEEHFKIVLFGAFSTEKELKREYLRSKTHYPVYYADENVLDVFNLKTHATPQTFLILDKPQLISVGLKKCSDLKKLLMNGAPY